MTARGFARGQWTIATCADTGAKGDSPDGAVFIGDSETHRIRFLHQK